MYRRRDLLAAGLVLPLAPLPALADDEDAAQRLRAGGVVVALRHALAPGTFDPPGFTLDSCATQRNLSDEGRAQARRIGQWFRARGLQPAVVRTSPWCRCVDTATLAFGGAETWAALGSPRGSDPATNVRSPAAAAGGAGGGPLAARPLRGLGDAHVRAGRPGAAGFILGRRPGAARR
ncbi:MAG: histidine phosphatase family protein [Rubrivivax sp.]|nr:histidine phosphatase family protein [Rubrivivax sp.]